jgi:glycosyltransferase involved in cell wall biosynthesis
LWDEAKNFALVASAAKHVKWKIYAAGDHGNADGSARCGSCVQMLGALEPAILARWMAAAPIFLAPAKYEPFGLSILEAALSGCALILGDIPSLHELWDGAALFVATDDAASLIRGIEQLIDNPQDRERLGRQARARALTFSESRMTGAYLQAYSELMEGVFTSSAEAAACR